jgi:hypothetical protein
MYIWTFYVRTQISVEIKFLVSEFVDILNLFL